MGCSRLCHGMGYNGLCHGMGRHRLHITSVSTHGSPIACSYLFDFMDIISLQGKTNVHVEPPPSYHSFFITRIAFGDHLSPLGSTRVSSAHLKYRSPPPLLTLLSLPA